MALIKAAIEDNYFEDYDIDAFFYKLIISSIVNMDLTPNEFTLLMYIVNQTIGYRSDVKLDGKEYNEPKKWDFIAHYLFENKLKATRRTVDKALKHLEEENLISVYRDASMRKSKTTAKYNAYSLHLDFMDMIENLYIKKTGKC